MHQKESALFWWCSNTLLGEIQGTITVALHKLEDFTGVPSIPYIDMKEGWVSHVVSDNNEALVRNHFIALNSMNAWESLILSTAPLQSAMCQYSNNEDQAIKAVLRVIVKSAQKPKCTPEAKHLKTTTTATTLATGRIRWSRGNILDSANLHARAGKSAKGRLGAWAWGLGSAT